MDKQLQQKLANSHSCLRPENRLEKGCELAGKN
jgi:hypothetical protein